MTNAQRRWVCAVQDLVAATKGELLGGSSKAGAGEFTRVGTDSRADLTGRLFVPLQGENFDAHDFIPQAITNGAVAVLVREWRSEWEPLRARAAFVRVGDTLQALQAFARWWRKKQNFQVLAITGSNGKTSTKEFTHMLLRKEFSTHAAKGSYNNHWGVPISILEAGPEHTHLILELGMNKAGEIWRLCQIAEPNVVVATTVGRAHIGELGGQDKVAQAKEEIYLAAPDAIHVFNMDNEWTMRMAARSHSRKIEFSAFNPETDVHLRAQRINWDGLDIVGHIQGVHKQKWVHVLGRQNTVNLMAASSLALAAGMHPEIIWSEFDTLQNQAWGRNQLLRLSNGARVLFDGYNSNPDSLQALLKNLYEIEVGARKFLIAGDMKELGTFSEQAHVEAGERAASVGFQAVWFIGEFADAFARGLKKGAPIKAFIQSRDVDPEISRHVLGMLEDGDFVAIKGSRGMALERVLADWPLTTPLGHKP